MSSGGTSIPLPSSLQGQWRRGTSMATRRPEATAPTLQKLGAGSVVCAASASPESQAISCPGTDTSSWEQE